MNLTRTILAGAGALALFSAFSLVLSQSTPGGGRPAPVNPGGGGGGGGGGGVIPLGGY